MVRGLFLKERMITMPSLDMPLEKLREYKGSTPTPADFDEFWDESLKELDSVDTNLELIPAEFTCPFADCYDMYFNSTAGRIHAKLLLPKDITKPVPALLKFHGYHGDAGEWSEHLNYVAAGIAVASMDCRGQSGKSIDEGICIGDTLSGFITKGLLGDPKDMYYTNTFLDTALFARIIMNLDYIDETRVAATGISQGGGLTIACAALEPRLVAAVPCVPFLSDYKRVWEMDLDKDAYHDLRTFFRYFDPFHEKEEEYFTKLGYTDVSHLAPRIKGEVLQFSTLRDNICPPSTQFAAYNNMTCKKQIKIAPDFAHEVIRGQSDMAYEFILSKLL